MAVIRGVRGLKLWGVLALCSQLSGCIPLIGSYDRVEVEGASYLRTECYGGYGEPKLSYFPYHGIYLSISLHIVQLGVHVPAGHSAQLKGSELTVTGQGANGPVTHAFTLYALPQGALGSDLRREFQRLPDPFPADLLENPELAASTGVLSGDTQNGQHIWYSFQALDPVNKHRPVAGMPASLKDGSVEIPPMIIDGKAYPAKVFRIEQRKAVGVLPVNC